MCNLRDNRSFPPDRILKKVCDREAGSFPEISYMDPESTWWPVKGVLLWIIYTAKGSQNI